MTARRPKGWAPCWALFSISVTVGCQLPQSSPPLAPTAPPGSALARTWSSIRWEVQALPESDGVLRILGVAAGQDGVVAIGHDESGPGSRIAIWFSPDGYDWRRVGEPGMLADIQPADVAATDDGFSIIGTVGAGPTAVVLQSSDGGEWQRLADGPQFANAGVSSLAGRGDQWIAVGTDELGRAVSIRSVGGASWERLSSDDMGLRDGVVSSITPSPDGWIGAGAMGPDGRGAAAFQSADGIKWQQIILPGSAPSGEDRLETASPTVGRWATLIQGIEATNCGFLRECEFGPVTWWSVDRKAWTRLPATEEAPRQGSLLAAAGDVGFVAVSAGASWVSADGLSWAAFDGFAGTGLQVLDLAVIGDTIVAVGEGPLPNGTTNSSVGWIATGQGRTD